MFSSNYFVAPLLGLMKTERTQSSKFALTDVEDIMCLTSCQSQVQQRLMCKHKVCTNKQITFLFQPLYITSAFLILWLICLSASHDVKKFELQSYEGKFTDRHLFLSPLGFITFPLFHLSFIISSI